jgi:hypothetical protein
VAAWSEKKKAKWQSLTGGVAERLFVDFWGPSILGGEVKPGRPIGTRVALALGPRPGSESPEHVIERRLGDIDLVAHVELARVRIARKLLPIDRLPEPTWPEWAMAAALHDLVQSTHPGWNSALRRGGPRRLLAMVEATMERVPLPATLGESVARHTWFSRLFTLARVDSKVSWWTGSALFRGRPPPHRLTAWPELRQVHVERTAHPLTELPDEGAAVPPFAFASAVRSLLRATPLTDLANASRASTPNQPGFAWSTGSLGLVASPAGRTLALRALAAQPRDLVDDALGRATLQLLQARAGAAAHVAADLLRERALSWAESSLSAPDEALGRSGGTPEGRFARAAGARMALTWLGEAARTFAEHERLELVRLLETQASMISRMQLEAVLGGQPLLPPSRPTTSS